MNIPAELSFDTILTELKRQYATSSKSPSCLEDKILFDYVCHDLPEAQIQNVTKHFAQCLKCRLTVLKMQADRTAWNDKLDRAFEKISNNAEQKKTPIIVIENIVMEYWEPKYAGMELTAADMRPEPFQFQEGQITIKAFWEGAHGDKPAYIWVEWDVRVQPPFHLHLRFIAPETGTILYEVDLGQTTKDSESFNADELHFDPTTTRFGIVAFTESPQ